MQGVKIPDQKIIQVLSQNYGLITKTAKDLGMSREALSNRLNNDPDLKMALTDIRELNTDEAESQLFKQIREGQSWAICFYLKCLGKKRGYVERLEHTGEDGGPIQVEATIRAQAELFMKGMNKFIEDQGVVIDVEANGKGKMNGNGTGK